jgi:hypothetical protein
MLFLCQFCDSLSTSTERDMNKVQYESLALRPVVPQAGHEDYLLVLTGVGVRRLPSGRSFIETEDATPTVLNAVTLADNSAVLVTGLVLAFDDVGDSRAWRYTAHAMRGADATTVAVVGTVDLVSLSNTAGAASWDLDITANTTDGSIEFVVTGVAGDVRWTNQQSVMAVV